MMTKEEARAHLHEQLGRGGEYYWNRIVGGGYIDGFYTPWCACFTSTMFQDFGVECAGLPNTCALSIYEVPEEDLRLGFDMEPLDVINFDWDSDDSADHIGIVESVHDWGCRCFEGNVGDPSHVALVDRYWNNILFGVHPHWDEEEEMKEEDFQRIERMMDEKLESIAYRIWGFKNPSLEDKDSYQILRDIRTALGIEDGQTIDPKYAIKYSDAAVSRIERSLGAK